MKQFDAKISEVKNLLQSHNRVMFRLKQMRIKIMQTIECLGFYINFYFDGVNPTKKQVILLTLKRCS